MTIFLDNLSKLKASKAINLREIITSNVDTKFFAQLYSKHKIKQPFIFLQKFVINDFHGRGCYFLLNYVSNLNKTGIRQVSRERQAQLRFRKYEKISK